jgi:hypothetical protein
MTFNHRAYIELAFVLLIVPSRFAWADGGIVRLSERADRYQVTVFSSPTPLRAGWADFSALVQNAGDGSVLQDVDVVFRLSLQGRPEQTVDCRATRQAARNKMMKSAVFQFPAPGTWDVEVLLAGPLGKSLLKFQAPVEPPLPRWFAMLPWIALPLPVIVVFALYEMLSRQKNKPV